MDEATLIDRFYIYLIKQFGKVGVDYYKVHESSYGKCGQPDLQVKIKGVPYTLFIEVKKYVDPKIALKALRPTQRARIKEMLKADSKVYLLYGGGILTLYVEDYELLGLDTPDTTALFSGFKEMVQCLLTNKADQ